MKKLLWILVYILVIGWVAPFIFDWGRENMLVFIIIGILFLIAIVLFLGWAILRGKD